jgi:hypothetical protein
LNVRSVVRLAWPAAVPVALTACGGADSGPANYKVGGTVLGLVGSPSLTGFLFNSRSLEQGTQSRTQTNFHLGPSDFWEEEKPVKSMVGVTGFEPATSTSQTYLRC